MKRKFLRKHNRQQTVCARTPDKGQTCVKFVVVISDNHSTTCAIDEGEKCTRSLNVWPCHQTCVYFPSLPVFSPICQAIEEDKANLEFLSPKMPVTGQISRCDMF